MIEICGKQIPTALEELLEPKSTALVNIDLQNDSCSKGGRDDRLGTNISTCQAILPRVARLTSAARDAGALVIHTKNLTLPNQRGNSAAWLRFRMKNYLPPGEADFALEGTWGADFADEVKPQPEDIVVGKQRSDAFHGTNLDLILRSNNIKTVVITGVVTQGCVESTARSAAFHDYFVVVARDCVATTRQEYHEPSLKVMEYRFDVVTSEDVIKAWDSLAGQTP